MSIDDGVTDRLREQREQEARKQFDKNTLELKDSHGRVVAKIMAANPDALHADEGIWLEVQADDGMRPTLCLMKTKSRSTRTGPEGGDWYIGMYRDAKNVAIGCDFGISFTADGPVVQVVKGNEVKSVNLFDLLEKLGM